MMLDQPSMHLCSMTMSRWGSASNAEMSSSSSRSPSGPSTRTVQSARSISLRMPMRPFTWIGVASETGNSGADRLCDRLLHTASLRSSWSAQGSGDAVVDRLVLEPPPPEHGAGDAGRAGEERTPRSSPELVRPGWSGRSRSGRGVRARGRGSIGGRASRSSVMTGPPDRRPWSMSTSGCVAGDVRSGSR